MPSSGSALRLLPLSVQTMSHAVGSTRSGSAAATNSRAQAERAARQLQQSATVNAPQLVPPAVSAQPPEESTDWFTKLRERLLGDQGASYGVSLLVHVVILAVFAVPVIQHVTREEPLIASIVEESAGGGSPFGLPDMVNTELAPAKPLVNSPAQLAVPDLAADESLAVSKALLGTPEGQGGQGTGTGAGIGAGDVGNGMMQFVPKNAVRKGSFAAWTTPVFSNGYQRKFGEPEPKPGDSPHPMQPYWITIQIQVPGDRTRFPIRDLVGEVIGTDGYRNVIPRHTFVLDKEGQLQPLVGKQTVPVIDGFVQFVVQVPGARKLVKDTIVIKSKLLKEEQALEIVFSGAPPRDVQEEL
jgi:hypothetical protein